MRAPLHTPAIRVVCGFRTTGVVQKLACVCVDESGFYGIGWRLGQSASRVNATDGLTRWPRFACSAIKLDRHRSAVIECTAEDSALHTPGDFIFLFDELLYLDCF